MTRIIDLDELPPKERLVELKKIYENGMVVSAWKYTTGLSVKRATGKIEEEPELCSGIWGHGGDSIAVKINNEYYPSGNVKVIK